MAAFTIDDKAKRGSTLLTEVRTCTQDSFIILRESRNNLHSFLPNERVRSIFFCKLQWYISMQSRYTIVGTTVVLYNCYFRRQRFEVGVVMSFCAGRLSTLVRRLRLAGASCSFGRSHVQSFLIIVHLKHCHSPKPCLREQT